jgi:flagellar assembly protein FliH
MSTSCKEIMGADPPMFPFSYRQIVNVPDFGAQIADTAGARESLAASASAEEIERRVQQARGEAVAEAEQRLRKGYEEKLTSLSAQVNCALEQFAQERRSYFSRVETEVVRLALSIAARILHRETQVDPMLVAALVRIAIEKMRDGSTVKVRVAPGNAAGWRANLGESINGSSVEIVEDQQLGPHECVLETKQGSADYSIEAQLKEIEQGFFDLLAHRPEIP